MLGPFRLTRELFLEEYAHRINAAVRSLDVPHNKKHKILNAIYNAIPDRAEWEILNGVMETAMKYLKDLTGHENNDPYNYPTLSTEDGVWFTILPGVPLKNGDGYDVPLFYSYSHVVKPHIVRDGRFRARKVYLHLDGDKVTKGPTIDELRMDLENTAITHLMHK